MNHKNFHFTKIPDKTNDVMWSFLPNGDFSQKLQLSHTTIYGSLTSCYVLEKTNEPIPRKLTYGRKDGGKDRPDRWTDAIS